MKRRNGYEKQADEGIRTRDLLITNELLYQLSYIGLIFIIILYQQEKGKGIWQNAQNSVSVFYVGRDVFLYFGNVFY